MEKFRDIKGYEGLYQISNLGRVKSLYKRFKNVTYLKPIVTNGYEVVTLHKDDKQEILRVHRLVAEAFIPNPENKPQVNHIDGCKTNNNVLNLEWVNQSENQLHAYRIGLQKPDTEKARMAKRVLTESEAKKVKEMLNEGLSTRKVASIFNVSKSMVGEIKCGNTYKEI